MLIIKVFFTTCSHKLTHFTTFIGQMTPSSFPQVINQADNQYSKGIGLYFGYILNIWMFIAVENPKKEVYNW
ncbi:MAG TPA: hypothetical protein DEB23_09805 [Chitinophagaceae bacterium]|nr:hypothetical protein [Chitinophagaceae bacterium]